MSNLCLPKQPNTIKEITYRKLKNINMTNFNKDVELHFTTHYSDMLSLSEKNPILQKYLKSDSW